MSATVRAWRRWSITAALGAFVSAIVLAWLTNAFVMVLVTSWLLMGVLLVIIGWRIRHRSAELVELCRAYADGNYTLRSAMPTGALSELGQTLDRLGERLNEASLALNDSRSLLDGALGALEEGVACINSLDCVVYANAAYLRMVKRDRVVGHNFYIDIADPLIAERVASARRGEPEDAVDITLLDAHLRVRVVAGDRNVVVLVMYDRSDIDRLEMRRRDFMSAVSHELKTPLTSILGFTETVLDDESISADTMRSFFQRIDHHAERLTVLVRDIIILSRLEEGQWPIHPIKVDLQDLGEQVLDDHREAAKAQQVELSLLVPGSSSIVSDPELLRLLIANVLSNAIRYNKPLGKVRVTLTGDKERLRIEVADTGIGIPAEHQQRIFERFYRVDSHRSRNTGGTGLGLSIVKHLTTCLQGRIELQSSSQGTTFVIVVVNQI